jgi:hypothetical protein
MERTEILDLKGELKLFGMRSAYDEVIANGVKRRHEPQRIIGDLLKAEIAENAAGSIKNQLAIAKLPLAKDLTDFEFMAHRSTRRSSPVCRPARRRPKRFCAPTVAIGAPRSCIETRTPFSVKTATLIEAAIRRATSFPLLELLSTLKFASPSPTRPFACSQVDPPPLLPIRPDILILSMTMDRIYVIDGYRN